jgi:hypothetical protein
MLKSIKRLVAVVTMTSVFSFGGIMIMNATTAQAAAAAVHHHFYHNQSGHEYRGSGTTHTYHEFNHVDVYVTIG